MARSVGEIAQLGRDGQHQPDAGVPRRAPARRRDRPRARENRDGSGCRSASISDERPDILQVARLLPQWRHALCAAYRRLGQDYDARLLRRANAESRFRSFIAVSLPGALASALCVSLAPAPPRPAVARALFCTTHPGAPIANKSGPSSRAIRSDTPSSTRRPRKSKPSCASGSATPPSPAP